MKNNPIWPRSVRQTIAALAELITIGLSAGLDRARNSCATGLRGMADLIALQHELSIKDLQLSLVLNRLRGVSKRHRPYYSPEDRLRILRFHWQYGWSTERIAKEFVLDVSSVRRWLRVWNAKGNPGLFFGKVAWNRFHDALYALVHDIRGLIPEADFGTRSLADRLRNAAIKISRATIQRVLRNPKPKTSLPATTRKIAEEPAVKPHTILAPTHTNQVWHLDITEWRVLFITVHIAAVLDGYSRKLLSIRAYFRAPSTARILSLIRKGIAANGRPRFIVTDHGSIFRSKFKKGLGKRICLVKGKVRSCKFNGKVERFFRTFKLWSRAAGMLWHPLRIQSHLERFQRYYNLHRTHQALHGRTPESVWADQPGLRTEAFLARDSKQPVFRAQRLAFESDHHLPILRIDARRTFSRAA